MATGDPPWLHNNGIWYSRPESQWTATTYTTSSPLTLEQLNRLLQAKNGEVIAIPKEKASIVMGMKAYRNYTTYCTNNDCSLKIPLVGAAFMGIPISVNPYIKEDQVICFGMDWSDEKYLKDLLAPKPKPKTNTPSGIYDNGVRLKEHYVLEQPIWPERHPILWFLLCALAGAATQYFLHIPW